MLYIEPCEISEGILSETDLYGKLVIEYSGMLYDKYLTFEDILKEYSRHDLYYLLDLTYDYSKGHYFNSSLGVISTEIVDDLIIQAWSCLTQQKNQIFGLKVHNSELGKIILGYYTSETLQRLEDCTKLKNLLLHQK